MVLYGSFPFFLTGTNPHPSFNDNAAPKINPRDSIETILSIFLSLYFFAIWLSADLKPFGFLRSGVMSLKIIPAFGKSGTSLISFLRFIFISPFYRGAKQEISAEPQFATYFFQEQIAERVANERLKEICLRATFTFRRFLKIAVSLRRFLFF